MTLKISQNELCGDNYTKVCRAGQWYAIYDWSKGVTQAKFDEWLDRQPTQWIVCDSGYELGDECTIYLIDRQEREITKIVNPEVKKFLSTKVYMPDINGTYISNLLNHDFQMALWE